MFCPNCGAKLDDDCKFCTVCGNSTDSNQAEQSAIISNAVEYAESVVPRKKISRKKLVVLICGAVAVIAVFVIIGISSCLFGHSCGIGKCSRCGEIVNESVMSSINLYLTDAHDYATAAGSAARKDYYSKAAYSEKVETKLKLLRDLTESYPELEELYDDIAYCFATYFAGYLDLSDISKYAQGENHDTLTYCLWTKQMKKEVNEMSEWYTTWYASNS